MTSRNDDARWNVKRAHEWYGARRPIFGCNFLPSTAVNSVDMWQAQSFDEATIRRELSWASGMAYTSVRVFLPFIVWGADADGLKERLGAFLGWADAAGLSTLPILFDDCNFAGAEPTLGPQPDPLPGVHNSRWTASPGAAIADDPARRDDLEAYVTDLVSTFGADDRILAWDLYNEPANSGRGARSRWLVEAAFSWARACAPAQPLTAGSWSFAASGDGEPDEMTALVESLSDVVSFHCYEPIGRARPLLDRLASHGRPLLCTEWLHRPMGSRFQTHIALFDEYDVGIYQWGLVAGRTQTNLPWYTGGGAPNPAPREWQHDVLSTDGTPYDPEEVAVIRSRYGEDLVVKAQDMTREVMADLEARGLIVRLAPLHHELGAAQGETLAESIYESDARWGGHKLITVTVNRSEFAGFGTHPDNEEFLLIGDADTRPMYLAVALCRREEFEEKVLTGTLRAEDLVMLRVRYNDPEVSFFVMLANVPHGEAVSDGPGRPASFYVTESTGLPLAITEMRKYRLRVG